MLKNRIFKSLKVKNIYLKSIKYNDYDNLKQAEKLKISKDVDIEYRNDKDVSFILEERILFNEGKKAEIIVQVIIQVKIELIADNVENINDELKDIAKKIIDVNAVDKKISLLVGNVTSALGDIPIILPDESFEKESEEVM